MSFEQHETIRELSDLLLVVQEIAHRLADETHGDAYQRVRLLNETIHKARCQMGEIEAESINMQAGISPVVKTLPRDEF